LVGFYYARGGFQLSNSTTLDVRGTLYGTFIDNHPSGVVSLTTTADPDLAVFGPRFFPKKPVVASRKTVPLIVDWNDK